MSTDQLLAEIIAESARIAMKNHATMPMLDQGHMFTAALHGSLQGTLETCDDPEQRRQLQTAFDAVVELFDAMQQALELPDTQVDLDDIDTQVDLDSLDTQVDLDDIRHIDIDFDDTRLTR